MSEIARGEVPPVRGHSAVKSCRQYHFAEINSTGLWSCDMLLIYLYG